MRYPGSENAQRGPSGRLAHSVDVAAKVAKIAAAGTRLALENLGGRARAACDAWHDAWAESATSPGDAWSSTSQYAIDFAQRAILLWDTLRRRGNNFIEHERQGLPPVLHFEYETVMDGRTLARPVNYMLLRIVPPPGTAVDAKRRPYVIIDPRGGHGPGIGGFKEDSQVGVALRAGHPVYFVSFRREPEPGQTLHDVCNAEAEFVRRVRELHPDARKPAIVGNCQAGWAAMMLAASSPDDTGPVVAVGAPMSYWSGAWREATVGNPMRYAGGLLGGTWLASLTADLGAGRFDGAWLVQNFENLNPANTFWDKYYRVFANADEEPPRFLEFERWWGGFFLLNREEIEWITQNLFVGNRLWSGAVDAGPHGALDLRAIKAPIVLFASKGDNITPPQQAFNWVADVYGSTEEIKARGQVIVGLMHEDIGHLGIFVSGKVAKREHAQIVSVLSSIEALPPGLYGMEIEERKAGDDSAVDVRFAELRLEDVATRLNRFRRADEEVFRTTNLVSELNQRTYELFGRPWVQALSNEPVAAALRALHPLRVQRWAWSDLNPALWWLPAATRTVRAQRRPLPPEHPARRIEAAVAELASATFDCHRTLRDTASEAAFFLVYGNLHALCEERRDGESPAAQDRTIIQEALASIESGGYAEALARVAVLMADRDEALPLSRVQLAHELLEDHRELLPDLPPEELRRIAGQQEIIVRHARSLAIESLPVLLARREDRDRLLALLGRVLADERVRRIEPTPAQRAMHARLVAVLGADAAAPPQRRGETARHRSTARARNGRRSTR